MSAPLLLTYQQPLRFDVTLIFHFNHLKFFLIFIGAWPVVMHKKLNGFSIAQVAKKIKASKSRNEAASSMGVTLPELSLFIRRYLTSNPVQTKPHTGITVINSARVIRVTCDYLSGSIRKVKTVSVSKLKGGTDEDIEAEVSKVVAEFKKFRDENLRKFLVGVIVVDKEYTIPNLIMSLIKPSLKFKNSRLRLTVRINRGTKIKNISVHTCDYDEFKSTWFFLTDQLSASNGFSKKPSEWVTPPSESYYNLIISQLERSA